MNIRLGLDNLHYNGGNWFKTIRLLKIVVHGSCHLWLQIWWFSGLFLIGFDSHQTTMFLSKNDTVFTNKNIVTLLL